MSKQLNNTLYVEAIKWLSDMGCDESVNVDQRTFHGLRLTNDVIKASSFNEPKINKFNLDHINNITDLYKYVSLYLKSNNNILNSEFVFFDGYEAADLMIIGDKPDSTDIKIGKPFQGEAGNLLNAMLKAIGYFRENTYFTNINCCNSDVEIDISMQIVIKQIAIVKPKIIIMFGAEATKCLTKIDKDLFNTKGQWFDIDNIGMPSVIPCISMFHPRYILAYPKSKKESWIELKSVREKLS